ncbi:MAG TPA: hypothetical protein VGM67_04500 [Gemmatimonadaceae bacterium]|jgi:hypothetical protein
MTDRHPFTLTSTRIGRTNLGSGLIAVDEDAIVVMIHTSAEDRSIRVPCGAIDEIVLENGEVALRLRDGMRLSLGGEDAPGLRLELVNHCRALPEVTRALRAFGSRRGHASGRASAPDEQRRFFAPLLGARRDAVIAGEPERTLASFDAATLERLIGQTLHALATERYGDDAPARRALEAELVDLTEPLNNALHALGVAAENAHGSIDDLRLWRAWSAQLRATFETADRVWMSLDAALDATPWRA